MTLAFKDLFWKLAPSDLATLALRYPGSLPIVLPCFYGILVLEALCANPPIKS